MKELSSATSLKKNGEGIVFIPMFKRGCIMKIATMTETTINTIDEIIKTSEIKLNS